MTENNSLSKLLAPFQKKIEQNLKASIEALGPDSRLREACAYALLNGGKRFRPALVYIISKALNSTIDVTQAALAIEFFHTASLIADDLPCMDNDDLRRDKPSLHKVYGESTALLASYALIAAGYECLSKNASIIRDANCSFSNQSDRICVLALENATYNTGLLGATGGQYLDINPPNLDLETIREVLRMKTVSLFEISFVFGWLYSGGSAISLDLVKKAAYHFGMAFQIADDFGDKEQDIINKRLINLVNIYGEEKAFQVFSEELNLFKTTLKDLKLDAPELMILCKMLETEVEKYTLV